MKTTFEQELQEKGILVYTNVGDSMMPLIEQGKDVIVIKRPSEWDNIDIGESTAKLLKKYDVPLYKRDTGEYVLHRVLKVRKNDYIICGDNRFWREEGISDRHILGILSEVIKEGRTISVESEEYKKFVKKHLRKHWKFYNLKRVRNKIVREIKKLIG